MRKPTLHLCAVGLILCFGPHLSVAAAEATSFPESPARPLYWPGSVTLEGGTTGFGGSGSWRFHDYLGLRLGGDFFQYSKNDAEIKGIHYDAKLRLLSEPLTLDIYPWPKHSFHISVGAMFNQNELTGTSSDNTTIIIDGKHFPINQVGSLDLQIKQQPVNPYLSIGGNFFYFDRAHHWALGGELGVAYTGDPRVSLTRSGPAAPLIDAAVNHEQKRIEDSASDYKWWPVVKLTTSYSF